MICFGAGRDRKVLCAATIATLGLLLGWLPKPAWAQACAGDCDGSGAVTVDEIVTVVNIALESLDVSSCTAGDTNASGDVTVDEIVAAVNSALNGCPTGGPTPAPTATPRPGSSLMAGEGLLSSITTAAVGDAGQITVTFSLTDASGIPIVPVLARTDNPQEARVRFTLAHLEDYVGGGDFGSTFTRYVNDIDPTRPKFDSGGTLQAVDATAGLYRYTFNTRLPDDFDLSRTCTVGLQVDRTFDGEELGVNPIFDFVPAGGTPEQFAGSATQQCNNCHNPLIAHGNRREFRLCTLCHTEAAVDEKGRSVDMRVMIHKIHRGEDLPSIVGGEPGAAYAIFSSFLQRDVVFAAKGPDGTVTGVGFPRSIEDCEVCHAGGATAEFHRERPSATACASCHDDVNPSLEDTAAGPAGTNHFLSNGFADGDCSFCHISDSGEEFDISVEGAHTIPERSRQLTGLKVTITGVSNAVPGQAPTIAFKVTDNAGAPISDLSGLDRLAFALAGPTSDFATVLTATAVGGGASGTLTASNQIENHFEYTPDSPIPADAMGTWSVGAEARRTVELASVDPIPPKTVEEAAVNPVVTFSVDDSLPLARRTVVQNAKCASCHGDFSKDFSIHGNLRNQIDYCVMCHNPNNSDAGRRRLDSAAVERGDQTTSIDFKVMIHKIHTGEDLEQKPYVIFGFGLPPQGFTIDDFSDLRFPGDRRDCATCHVGESYELPPFPDMAQGTGVAHLDPVTGDEVVDGRIGPIQAVCTSCHDGDDAVAHAQTLTADDGAESCPVCHEEGRDFAVSLLHREREEEED
ncbi:MAG: OmcA/MtrC family decaheme c-type cytochrome [Candidatus Binatia bacterium]